jgi:hypothetical protein
VKLLGEQRARGINSANQSAGRDRGKLACLCIHLVLHLHHTIPSIRAAMKRTRLRVRNDTAALLEMGEKNGWNMEDSPPSCVEEEDARRMIAYLQMRYHWGWCVEWLKELSLERFLGGNARLRSRRNDIIQNIDVLASMHTKFDNSMYGMFLGEGSRGDAGGDLNSSLNSSLNESVAESGYVSLLEDMCHGNTTFEVSQAGFSPCNGIYHPEGYWDSVPMWVMETEVNFEEKGRAGKKMMKFTIFRVDMNSPKMRNWYLSEMDEIKPGTSLPVYFFSFVFILLYVC